MKIKTAILIGWVLMWTTSANAWTGDSWGPISRETITTLAGEMIDSTWTPVNDITNYNGLSGTKYYAGTRYTGEPYTASNRQNWDEFHDAVSATAGGNTSFGNYCASFVNISWKLPNIYSIPKIDSNLGGDLFYALGEVGDSPYVALLPGDAFYTNGHIFLFSQYNADGTIQSLEQAAPFARRRTWSWSALAGFRPIRRNLINGGIVIYDQVQSSFNVSVRSCPSVSCNVIWTAPIDAQGVVVDGPQNAGEYRWWKVQFDSYGTVGWTTEGYLRKLESQTVPCINIPDSNPPVGSISINAGAKYTNSESVMLNLTCSDSQNDCAWMSFSRDGSVWSEWEPYATERNWNLMTGIGSSTVYVKFKDACGSESTSYSSSITYQQAMPDLTVSSLIVPSAAEVGSTISISDTTMNIGLGGANSSTTTLFLSSDAVADSTDAVVGFRYIPALEPAASSQGASSIRIPLGTRPGIYYLIARANSLLATDDCGYISPCGALIETNRGNNTRGKAIYIGMPDLVVSSVTTSSLAAVGATINIIDTTANIGAGGAAASTTSYYLSTDKVLDAGDILLGSRSIPALAAGAGNVGTAAVTIPSGLAAGTYYIIAKADSVNALIEANENNNTRYVSITVLMNLSMPDLVISSLTTSSAAAAGSAIRIADTTSNAGTAIAAASTTSYYLSTNSILDAGDIILGSRSVPALATGASSTGSIEVTIPLGISAGKYYVIAKADIANVVSEVTKNNNIKYVTVYIGMPDVVISSLTISSSAIIGSTISIVDTTANIGMGNAAASMTSYYLSANNVLDVGDILLGSRTVPALAAGESNAGVTELTIPSDLSAGTYYIIAKADYTNEVDEVKEMNNMMTRRINILMSN